MKNISVISKTAEIPTKDKNYVEYGNFEKVCKIIESGKFFPTWVTGNSGNGKSVMIEQACAKLGRKFIRMNFNCDTDEQDLLGSFSLVEGDTIFSEGGIVTALREGAILLLDEVDSLSSSKALILQSLLEGKGVHLKALNEWVTPQSGFNIFATSNTKGKGSDSGRFIGTNLMNSAFLDRFVITLHQEYPPKDIEEKIINNYIASEYADKQVPEESIESLKEMCKRSVEWANQTRKEFAEDGEVTEIITTRALINLFQTYFIFNDEIESVKMVCERFDEMNRDSLISFYEKLIDYGEIEDSEDIGEEIDLYSKTIFNNI